MSLYSSVHRFAADWVRARRAAHTARLLNDLPAEVRKDIGWPGSQSVPPVFTVLG